MVRHFKPLVLCVCVYRVYFYFICLFFVVVFFVVVVFSFCCCFFVLFFLYWHVKGYSRKRKALKVEIIGPEITVRRCVRASFSPEILPGGAVKGFNETCLLT